MLNVIRGYLTLITKARWCHKHKNIRDVTDLVFHVARLYMSCIPLTKRHAKGRYESPVRALSAFADLDHVREHVFEAIEPRDQVTRSGWVGFRQ
jgi:hypothetical protein